MSCLADETEKSKVLINNHLTSLWKQFSLYFKDLDMSKYEYDGWYLPYESTARMVIDLSGNSTLKQMFWDENNIVTFWLRVKDDFSTLPNKALETLLPFRTYYLCETGVFLQ